MPNVELFDPKRLPAFRKIALGTWAAPGDPQVYGALELRMEPALAYLETYRAATGRRLTVTHLVAKAVAAALTRVPEANALLRLGRVQERTQVSLFLQVALEDPETGKPDLSGLTLHGVESMDLVAILDAVERSAARVRARKDAALEQSRRSFSALPGLLVRPVLALVSFLLYTLNLDLRRFGLPRDGFGSAMITNIGSLGLEEAYVPLVPWSRTPILICVGAVQDRPVVENGAVVVGKLLRLGATFDHRYIDGAHAAVLARELRAAFADPEQAFGPPPPGAGAIDGAAEA